MTEHHTQAPGDHPGASPFPPLTDAEVRIAREDLGVSMEWLAARLEVTERTVRRWEAGTSTIPQGAADAIGHLLDEADEQVDAWAARLLDVADPALRIPRAEARDGYPPGWWRAVAARLMEQVPGLRVTYS